MVQITIDYAGDLRCEAVHGPSGKSLHTDAPVDNQGRGESFSPTDLLATSLGSCMLTIMGIAAAERGWELRGTRVTVVKHMAADPRRRVAKLEVTMEIPGDFDERQRKVLEEAARTCPVTQSLAERLEVVLEMRWGKTVPR